MDAKSSMQKGTVAMDSSNGAMDSGVVEWLLEDENPSVRYATMVELLGVPDSDPAAEAARRAIMERGVVPAILEKQVGACWESPGRFYLEKYRGTVWQVMILAELYASGDHPGIRKACQFLLAASQDRTSHGFAPNESASEGGGRHSEVIPCLTGNMAWAMERLGFGGEPRVRQAMGWIAEFQRFDDGSEAAPKGWPYDRYAMCWGTHSCHMGVVKALKALAELPVGERTPAMADAIDRGVEYLLRHHVHKRSHDLSSVSRPGWLKLGFPLMYQTDVLEILGILTGLGRRDERMQEAIDVVAAKRGTDGTWKLENSFNGKYHVDIEAKGKPSKWITLRALRALRAFYGKR